MLATDQGPQGLFILPLSQLVYFLNLWSSQVSIEIHFTKATYFSWKQSSFYFGFPVKLWTDLRGYS